MTKYINRDEFANVLRSHLRNLGEKKLDAVVAGIEDYVDAIAVAATKKMRADDLKRIADIRLNLVRRRSAMLAKVAEERERLVAEKVEANAARDRYIAEAKRVRSFLSEIGAAVVEEGTKLVAEAEATPAYAVPLPKVVDPVSEVDTEQAPDDAFAEDAERLPIDSDDK